MAVRPIDAVQALKDINWHHKPTPVSEFESGFNQGLNQAMWIITHAPTLTPPNEPLTLAELREMDGEPVWDEKGKCYLVDTTYQFCSDSDIEIAIVDKRSIKRYPYRRTLYRRPPEGEEDK